MKHVLNIIQYSITKMFRDNVKRLIKSLSTFFYQVTLMFCVLMNVVAFENKSVLLYKVKYPWSANFGSFF